MAGIVAQKLERNLLPLPDIVTWNQGKLEPVSLTTSQKIQYFIRNIFKMMVDFIVLLFAMIYSMGKYTVSLFTPTPKKEEPVNIPFDPNTLPPHFGFADSLFQTSGLGTKASATPLPGVCNFEKFMNPQRIEGTTEADFRKFFIDVLRNPQPFIHILRQMNVTAHRFSLEWAVIEPQKGQYDQEAIQLYRNFFHQLRENGIEPYITSHHFVCPEWFEQEGGFAKLENVEIYKNHVLRMMEIFPEITNWMPFNEINIDAFQKYVRGVYPPGIVGDMAGAGVLMRNMLLAHCQIYKEAKARWPHLQIGSSHQWLNFEPLENNPLEQAICYFLSKITHYACYNFLKTGQFSLEIPGKANVQFTMPEEEWRKHNGFSDFIGVQFYGYPRLKAGFNGGKEYPGYLIQNFNFWKFGLTFGSTCPEGGESQSFGPGSYPESFEKCFTEAVALKKPIVVSETGYDANIQKWGEKAFKIDNEAQRRGIAKLLPTLAKFKDHLKAVFFWTLYRKPDVQLVGQEDFGQLEWDRGATSTLGLVQILKDQNRNIIGHRMTPAADLIQDIFGRKRAEMARNVPIAVNG